jgi:hypothetical protein
MIEKSKVPSSQERVFWRIFINNWIHWNEGQQEDCNGLTDFYNSGNVKREGI